MAFGSTGPKTISSEADSGEPDVDGDSTDRVQVVVRAEDADLAGSSESSRVVLGDQATTGVYHPFSNRGPTAVGGATVAGTVTGGTIVPGSFNFFRDSIGGGTNVADDQCSVTATTFTCEPVFSEGVFYAPQPFVFYQVTLPTTPGTVVSTATITGRADPPTTRTTPRRSRSTSTRQPPRSTPRSSAVDPIPPAEPFRVNGPVINAGQLDANDLVAVLQVPADWGVEVPPDELPAGTTCAVVTTPHAVRCTRDVLPAGEGWSVDAIVTPPAGTGSGTVTLTVTTVSTETGTFPNEASTTIRYAPGRDLLISPDGGLADGDLVTLSGTGFNPGAEIFYCQGIITGATPTGGDCGAPYRSTTADESGAFSTTVVVERFLVVRDTGVVDCAQPAAACGIGAGDLLSPGGKAVIEPVSFDPLPPVDDPFGARIEGTSPMPTVIPCRQHRSWASGSGTAGSARSGRRPTPRGTTASRTPSPACRTRSGSVLRTAPTSCRSGTRARVARASSRERGAVRAPHGRDLRRRR